MVRTEINGAVENRGAGKAEAAVGLEQESGKAFKKKFFCYGTVTEHSEYGEVVQLQGD